MTSYSMSSMMLGRRKGHWTGGELHQITITTTLQGTKQVFKNQNPGGDIPMQQVNAEEYFAINSKKQSSSASRIQRNQTSSGLPEFKPRTSATKRKGQNERSKKYYRNNRESVLRKNREDGSSVKRNAAFRRDLKHRAVLSLGGKCSKCGYDRCEQALEFHHKNSEEKRFTLSSAINRLTENSPEDKFIVFWGEVARCELVCANCHREEHYNQQSGLV